MFRQRLVVPLAPRVGIWVRSFKIICPVPSAIKVRSSLVPVVISVVTPEKVSDPVVVIAPEEMVPMFVRLPLASMRSVPLVWIEPVALSVAPIIVPDAVMDVAPEMAPVLVIPPELFSIPPLIVAPPAEIVNPPVEMVWVWVKVLAAFL